MRPGYLFPWGLLRGMHGYVGSDSPAGAMKIWDKPRGMEEETGWGEKLQTGYYWNTCIVLKVAALEMKLKKS